MTSEGARLKPRGPEPPMPGGGLMWGLQKSPGPGGLLSCPVHGAVLTPFQGPAHPGPLVTEPPHFLWPAGYSRCPSHVTLCARASVSPVRAMAVGGEGEVRACTQGSQLHVEGV